MEATDLPEMDMNKEEHDSCSHNAKNNFVKYDPDNLPYEKLQLCTYLSELPELTPEDVKHLREE